MNTDQPFDTITVGRYFVDFGRAILEGRIQITGSVPLPPSFQSGNGDVAHDRAHAGQDNGLHSEVPFLPPLLGGGPVVGPAATPEARLNARGKWGARKGYRLKPVLRGKKAPGTEGVTPAGFRLLEYVKKVPDQSAQQIADSLGFSRKTIENLLSLLKKRHLISVVNLTPPARSMTR